MPRSTTHTFHFSFQEYDGKCPVCKGVTCMMPVLIGEHLADQYCCINPRCEAYNGKAAGQIGYSIRLDG